MIYKHYLQSWAPTTRWISTIVIASVASFITSPDVCAAESPLPLEAKRTPEVATQREAKAIATNEQATIPGIIVLDTGDSHTKPPGARSGFFSTLRLLSADGQELGHLADLNQVGTVGGTHCISIDRQRGRIYFLENGAQSRLTALDWKCKILWRLECVEPSAIAVDPKSGNIWCEVGTHLVDRKTIVVGSDGKIVTEYPWGGVDIVYDPQADVFWISGDQIMRVDREGKLSLRRPLPELPGLANAPTVINARNWLAVSITPDIVHTIGSAHYGGAWVAIRNHPDVMGSRNRLIRLNDKGESRALVELAEVDPFAVACDTNGNCWVADRRKQLLRFNGDGEQDLQLPIPALAVAANHKQEGAWVSTNEGLLRIDGDGQITWQSKFSYRSEQTWLGVTGP